jgi:hypothetical protein
MVRTTSRQPLLIWLLLFLVAPLLAPAEPVRVLVTANLERIFPALSPDPKLEDSDLQFEKALLKLRDDNPDAFLIDAGRAQSISHTNETGYSVPVWNVFEYNNYHLTNLDARESITATDGIFGIGEAPESFRQRAIATAVGNRFEPLDIPPSRTVKTAKGQQLSFTSLADLAATKGLGSRITQTSPRQPSEMFEAIAKARAAQVATIAFASSPALVPVFPDAASTPEVILSFDTNGAPRRVDAQPAGYWLVPVPAAGYLLQLDLQVEGDKVSQAPAASLVPYIDESLAANLIVYPKPRIGMLIPNLEHTLGQFFDTTRGSASLDRFTMDKVADLTQVAPNVYTVPEESGSVRVYRVMSVMPYYKVSGVLDPSWPQMDMLVTFDGEQRFQRLITRVEFPVAATPTVLVEDFNRRKGTNPDEWKFDPNTAAGVQEVWEWVAHAIRTTAEVDRRLHPQE